METNSPGGSKTWCSYKKGYQEDIALKLDRIDAENPEFLLDGPLGLVTALSPGSSGEEFDIFEDEFYEEKGLLPSKSNKRRSCIIVLLVAANMLMLVLILGLALRKNGSSQQQPSVATNVAPIPPPESKPSGNLGKIAEDHLLGILPEGTVEAIVLGKNSSQSQALEWISRDPLLSAYPDWRLFQRFSLATFFYATGGSQWLQNTNWLSYSIHECEWWHNTLGNVEGKFNSKDPCKGSHLLPGEVTEKGYQNSGGKYRHLSMRSNNVSGTLPLELFTMLPWLETIALHANPIGGTLSTLIGQLSRLEALSLGSTGLSGSIPSQIRWLQDLTHLDLQNNQLQGFLPVELGLLSALKQLDISKNKFYGPIPSEMGLLRKIESLSLARNAISGLLPTTFGNLENLNALELQENQLKAPLPTELGLLPRMQRLGLGGNQLTGTVPAWLPLTLKYLGLSHNLLSGSLNPINLPPNLTSLFLIGNALTGEIQSELGNLSHLAELALSRNNFTSTIPSELGLLSNLKGLFMNRNKLIGKIPEELSQLKHLKDLWLHSNQLNGSMPVDLWHNASSLEVVSFANNQLSGSIGSELGLVPGLVELDLSMNSLEGHLPTQLGLLSQLKRLDLHHNSLTGRIPSAVGILAATGVLETFHITYSEFEGTVPTPLCSIDSLSVECVEEDQCICVCDASCDAKIP